MQAEVRNQDPHKEGTEYDVAWKNKATNILLVTRSGNIIQKVTDDWSAPKLALTA